MMVIFVSNLEDYRDAKLLETAAKTARTQLGIESNWTWTTEMGTTFLNTSSLLHTSTTSYYLERG